MSLLGLPRPSEPLADPTYQARLVRRDDVVNTLLTATPSLSATVSGTATLSATLSATLTAVPTPTPTNVLCPSGQYNSGGLCTICTRCNASEYQQDACAPFQDADCQPLTVCNSSQYTLLASTNTTDRVCANLVSQCLDIQPGVSWLGLAVEPRDTTGRVDTLLSTLNSSLGDELVLGSATARYSGRNWTGLTGLPTIFPNLLLLDSSATLPSNWCVSGIPLDNRPFLVQAGCNRLGYSLPQPTALVNAFGALQPTEGDQVVPPLRLGRSDACLQ